MTTILLVEDDPALRRALRTMMRSRDLDVVDVANGEEAIVIASGGGADTTNPLLRCGLLLAGCNKPSDAAAEGVEDGILTGLEIVGTDLRGTELVVLSACETGLGEDVKGEGLIGLTRGFMYAGSPRVVVSLWSVDDEATSQLMATSYKNMLQHGRKPSAALRAAQIEMWQHTQWQAPFYWAAFTLQGEWE